MDGSCGGLPSDVHELCCFAATNCWWAVCNMKDLRQAAGRVMLHWLTVLAQVWLMLHVATGSACTNTHASKQMLVFVYLSLMLFVISCHVCRTVCLSLTAVKRCRSCCWGVRAMQGWWLHLLPLDQLSGRRQQAAAACMSRTQPAA
jgi:hypothetical protein